jgi:aminoglycoside N3'-acetyltransferase
VIVPVEEIQAAVRLANAAGRPVCVHASLRSFGHVQGGAQAVIEGLLAEGCTVLVPTFSFSAFAASPLPHQRPSRNAYDYGRPELPRPGNERIFTTTSLEIDREAMGAIPTAVLEMSECVRGNHPLGSFSAVGPLARELVAGQSPIDVYAPLRALAAWDGIVLLMGVGLNRMTLLHLAEQMAGRNPFRRWANGPDGMPMEVAIGGCSDGFVNFAPVLAPLVTSVRVGESLWQAYPVRATLRAVAAAIQSNSRITRCSASVCERCEDAILGGPVVFADPA